MGRYLMVVDALMLLASWHPGHESEYNSINPGLILSAGPQLERCQPYLCGGVYLDSHEHWASVLGGGVRFGTGGFGIDLAVAHVHGSDVEKYPVVIIPSIYYTHERWSFQAMLTAQAVGFGVRYRLKE